MPQEPFSRQPNPADIVAEKVDVPILTQARFLTLVAACSGLVDYLWIHFGGPFLERAAGAQGEIAY